MILLLYKILYTDNIVLFYCSFKVIVAYQEASSASLITSHI